MKKRILIENVTVVPMVSAAEPYYNASVGIEDNKIVLICRSGDSANRFKTEPDAEVTVIDGRGRVLMPGLINIHTHASMTLLRGYADDYELMDWLNNYIWPFEAKLQAEDYRSGARLAVAEMLAGGTTTMLDMYFNEDLIAQEIVAGGMRAWVGTSFLRSPHEKYCEELDRVGALLAKPEYSTVKSVIAPHAPYTVSDENLKWTHAEAARRGLLYHIHMAETLDEQKIIADKCGLSPVEYCHKLGILDRNTIAAHCVHLSQKDMDIMAECGVSVAHNPQSNMKLASGISPVAQMLKSGINVGLGTDGASSNNDLDMWEEMRTASLLAKVSTGDPCALPAYEALKMATVNGAAALGMKGQLGQIAEGMIADLILVNVNKAHTQPMHNLISTLVYATKSSDVECVIVDGKIVLNEGRLTRLNLAEVVADARHSVDAIIERMNADKKC